MLCSLFTLTSYGQVKQSDPLKADSSSKQNVSNHLIVKNHRVPTVEDTLNYYENSMIQIRNPQWLKESDRLLQLLRDEQNKLNKAKNKK